MSLVRTVVGSFLIIGFLHLLHGDNILTLFTSLFLLTYLLLSQDFTNTFKRRHPEIVNLSISLITTLLGVYVAIFLNNKQLEKDNEEQLISLMKGVGHEIGVHEFILGRKLEEINERLSSEDSNAVLQSEITGEENLKAQFHAGDILISNSLFLKYSYPQIIFSVIKWNSVLKNEFDVLNNYHFKKMKNYLESQKRVKHYLNALKYILNMQLNSIENGTRYTESEIEIKVMQLEVLSTGIMDTDNLYN